MSLSKRTRTVELYGGETEARLMELGKRLDDALYDESQSGQARMGVKSPVGKLAKEHDDFVASVKPEAVITLTEIPRQRVREITDDCPPREGKWIDQAHGMDYDKYIGELFVEMASRPDEPDWSPTDRRAFYADLGQAGFDKVRAAIEEITATEVDVPKYSAVSVVNQARESTRKRRSSTE